MMKQMQLSAIPNSFSGALSIFLFLVLTIVLAGSITQAILDFFDINISSVISQIFAFSFVFTLVFMIL